MEFKHHLEFFPSIYYTFWNNLYLNSCIELVPNLLIFISLFSDCLYTFKLDSDKY